MATTYGGQEWNAMVCIDVGWQVVALAWMVVELSGGGTLVGEVNHWGAGLSLRFYSTTPIPVYSLFPE